MSKFRIVIRAFTLRRDISSALILKELLEQRGCEVFLANSSNFEWVTKLWKPHCVVINTVSRIRMAAELAPDAAIIQWPGEGSEARQTKEIRTVRLMVCFKPSSNLPS